MTIKNRVLCLMDYLQRNSDEKHSVTAAEVREALAEKGCDVTMETLRRDVASLQEHGFKIEVLADDDFSAEYKWLDRTWNASELQLLVEAMSSAQSGMEQAGIDSASKDIGDTITSIVDTYILLSRNAWDSFETSRDFQRHPLLPPSQTEVSAVSSTTLSEPAVTYQPENSIDDKIMEFMIFCIENIAADLHRDAIEVYDLLTRDSDILYSYIIPCYEPLHTQDKGYICEDIERVMQERGLI